MSCSSCCNLIRIWTKVTLFRRSFRLNCTTIQWFGSVGTINSKRWRKWSISWLGMMTSIRLKRGLSHMKDLICTVTGSQYRKFQSFMRTWTKWCGKSIIMWKGTFKFKFSLVSSISKSMLMTSWIYFTPKVSNVIETFPPFLRTRIWSLGWPTCSLSLMKSIRRWT